MQPQKNTIVSQKFLSWIILFLLVLTWGSSFILIKRGLDFFSAVEVGALRVVLTFFTLLPFSLPQLFKISKNDFYWLSLSGIIGSFFPAFLFAMAQTGIDSSTAGLLNALTPLFTLVIGFLLFGIKSRLINVIGVFLGLAGALGLVTVSGGNQFAFNLKYASMIMLATILYAINVNLIKAKLKHINALTITSLTFFVAGIIASVILFAFTDLPNQLHSQPQAWKGLLYVAILAVVGTALAMVGFNTLIKLTTPIFASSVTYLIPIVAIIWGIADGEYFSLHHILWMGLIIGGVVLVNHKKGQLKLLVSQYRKR